MDRIASLEVFVLAAEFGSFSAVADALGISGPMVGKHVRAIERSIGTQLINRTTRRQHLTEAGQIFYERCKVVLAEFQSLKDVTSASAKPSGRLRVSVPVHLGRHCVAPILFRLGQRYPELQLELSFTDRLLDLASERLDLVVRTGALQSRSDHVARTIARQRMIVCCSPQYMHEHGKPEGVAAITLHDAITYGRAGQPSPWLFRRADGTIEQVAPRSRVLLDDLDAIADAAVAGLGLAWLPEWLVAARLKEGKLTGVLDERIAYLYECHAVWLTSPYISAKVRAAVDALVSELPGRVTGTSREL